MEGRRLTDETAAQLDEYFGGFAGRSKSVLLLDYDGTLARFRVDRFQARPWAGVRELLLRIQEQGRTQMAVITGRPAAEIAPMLKLDPPLEVWGLHGAERLYSDSRRELEQPPQATRQKLDQLREQLKRDSLGGLYEDKANAAVMHWRGYSPRKARLIEQRTRALFEPLARMPGLTLLDFDGGIELRAGRDKGGALQAILATAGGGPAAYLGDDLTDEAAFRAIKGRGLGVLVRRQFRETAASVWLCPPAEVKQFFERWLRACAAIPAA